jgi:hypothetical protein
VATNPGLTYRIIGGASFPAPVGTVTFSWPLVAAIVTTEGVDLAVRRTVFRWAFVGVMSDSPGPRGVSRFAWEDMAPASVARRTIVLRNRGGHSARFGVLRARSLAPLVEALRAHAVPIEQVRSTWRWELNLK